MGILINYDAKLAVQGITGWDDNLHAAKVKEYGTNVVGGISPGKAGQEVAGIPVFNTVKDAVKATGANTSVIFVPAASAKDAIPEAVGAGTQLTTCITEDVPALDVVKTYHYISDKGAKLIDPSYPGLIPPEESMVGIMPTNIFKKGHTGMASRNGTLTYQAVADLTAADLRQSTVVGVSGDPIVGLYSQDLLEMFQDDPETSGIALIGEIDDGAKERAANYIKQHVTKPVVAFISRRETPKSKQMRHAGAITSSDSGTAAERIATFGAVGVPVARETCEIPALLKKHM